MAGRFRLPARRAGYRFVKQRCSVKSAFACGVFLFLLIINGLIIQLASIKSVEFEL
jgi:hypothetical protein